MTATGTSGEGLPFSIKTDNVLRGIHDEYTEFQRLGTRGVMGDSYLAVARGSGEQVFIKMPHLPQEEALDFFLIKDKVTRVFAGLFAEYANFSRLKGIDCVAQIKDIGIFCLEVANLFPVLLPFIVQEYLVGKNLNSHFAKASPNPFTGLPSSQEWFNYSLPLSEGLLLVHDRNVVHGDLHPGNIMVNNNRDKHTADGSRIPIRIIDFGQAFLADCNLSAQELTKRNPNNFWLAPERREQGTHWSFSSDIYSLGAILFFLATGNPPEVPANKSDHAGYITDEISDKNPLLAKEEPGIAKVISKATEPNPTRRYWRVADLIRDLELFQLRYPIMPNPTHADITNVIKIGKKALTTENPLLREMVINSFQQLERKIASIITDNPRFEVIGDREEIISQLLHYLAVLNAGDEYWTVTTPLFWQPQNLGFNGRFMSMNEVMVRRGAKLRRIFMVTKADLETKLWSNIVSSHQRIYHKLHNCEDETTSVRLQEAFDVRYKEISEEQQKDLLGINHVVGLWVKDGSHTAIGFSLGDDNATIKKATFWSPEPIIAQGVLKGMKAELEGSISII